MRRWRLACGPEFGLSCDVYGEEGCWPGEGPALGLCVDAGGGCMVLGLASALLALTGSSGRGLAAVPTRPIVRSCMTTRFHFATIFS